MEEELKKSLDVVLETVAKEQEGQFSALKERMENVNDNVRRDLDDLEDRIVAAEQQVQKSLSSTESLTAGVDDLLKQLDELKAQIEGIATQKRPSEMPRKAAPPPEKPATTSDDSLAERRKKYNENLSEIAELKRQNPACVLKEDVGTRDIRNTDIRMATKADRRYCRKDKIVYVRNRFFCTKCDEEEYNPCNVSAKKGFPEWKKFRDAVDETTRIVNRIDELYRENAALKRGDG